jgi:hypothetical protein
LTQQHSIHCRQMHLMFQRTFSSVIFISSSSMSAKSMAIYEMSIFLKTESDLYL